MFTGIIEEVGRVRSLRSSARSCVLAVEADTVLEGTHIGDSIAVDGICLTVTELDAASFTADVMNETLTRSSLGCRKAGDPVNLERAVMLGGRLGGHIVSGHIDGTGTIAAISGDGNATRITISADPALLAYVVEKGSVAIDGISLTVVCVDGHSFSVSVIPHTQENTSLSAKRTGDKVNVETDIIGKYVARLLGLDAEGAGADAVSTRAASAGGITEAFLHENGF